MVTFANTPTFQSDEPIDLGVSDDGEAWTPTFSGFEVPIDALTALRFSPPSASMLLACSEPEKPISPFSHGVEFAYALGILLQSRSTGQRVGRLAAQLLPDCAANAGVEAPPGSGYHGQHRVAFAPGPKHRYPRR